ncbi:MAG: hypothetical protein ACP5DC_00150 [Halothiobacillaceae bacterium]
MSTTSKVLTVLIALMLGALLVMEIVYHGREEPVASSPGTGQAPAVNESADEPAKMPEPSPRPDAGDQPADLSSVDEAPRPWEQAPDEPAEEQTPRAPVPELPEPVGPQLSDEELAELNAIQREMTAIAAEPKPDLDRLDSALVRMAEITGNEAIGGIDLGQLRNNVAIARDLQALAEEIEREAERGEEVDIDKLQDLLKQMETLQGQLDHDFAMELPAP